MSERRDGPARMSDSPQGGGPASRRGRWAHPDEWEWRRRVRENPATRFPYRIAVGVVGGLFMILAALTGWLPGPGGIPLALIGLAILASEFDWARRILDRCKDTYETFVAWAQGLHPLWRWLGGVATVAGVVVALWGFLAWQDVPSFLPGSVASFADGLPGVER